jgi:hypothetical protein
MGISHLTHAHGVFVTLAFTTSRRVFQRRSRSWRSRRRQVERLETLHETASRAAGLHSRRRSCDILKTETETRQPNKALQ